MDAWKDAGGKTVKAPEPKKALAPKKPLATAQGGEQR